jgi:hypothetical protein
MAKHEKIDINIDLDVLASRLAKDPAFVNAVAKAIRTQMTADVRKMGNLLGTWAQQQPAPVVNPPKATRRLW